MANEEDRVVEWEKGLPSPEELIPLTKPLITPELASAFSITQEPCRTTADVLRASQATVAALRRLSSASIPGIESIPVFAEGSPERNGGFCYNTEGRNRASTGTLGAGSSDAVSQGTFGTGFQNQGVPSTVPFEGTKRAEGTGGSSTVNGVSYSSYERRPDNAADSEEADSGGNPENSNEDPEPGARTLKRPRLVWTPQLHKRFVDAVAHLGIKNAVPKTIMQLMNVEGLTRENVASHLQKYRLYLKRMQGLSSEGPSASDHLFASTPVPPALATSAHFLQPHRDDMLPLPFPGTVVPVPITGLGPHLGAPHPYAPFDHLQYGALARGPPQRVPSGDHVDNQPQNGSPGLLTLFPNH